MRAPQQLSRFLGSNPFVAGVVISGSLLLTSCGGSSSGASDPLQQMASANARLQGRWVLEEFQPATPLEPMLGSLLAVQLGLLTVQFDGARLNATGVGVQATRTYQITEATMNDFTATLRDATGVSYDVTGSFKGTNGLRFQSLTSPWTGQGTLLRAQ